MTAMSNKFAVDSSSHFSFTVWPLITPPRIGYGRSG